MPSPYDQKHPEIPHARSSDPDLYFKIILFALSGHGTKLMALFAGGKPEQTIKRNFNKLRAKLTQSHNYRAEIFNRFYHVDSYTADYYGKWRDELLKFEKLTDRNRRDFEKLVHCLTECPRNKKPRQFMQEDFLVVGYRNTEEAPLEYDPKDYPLVTFLLEDIDGYKTYINKKRDCKACGLCAKDRHRLIDIFEDSPYTYIDTQFHFSNFKIRSLEEHYDHLYFAWANGIMRGIIHMVANETVLEGETKAEKAAAEKAILEKEIVDFATLTYHAATGKVLPKYGPDYRDMAK